LPRTRRVDPGTTVNEERQPASAERCAAAVMDAPGDEGGPTGQASFPQALRAFVDALDEPAVLRAVGSTTTYRNPAASSPGLSAGPVASAPPTPCTVLSFSAGGRDYELAIACQAAPHSTDRAWASNASPDIDAAPASAWARNWRLSPRHARVAACLVHGFSDRQAAERLGLSVSTVRTYVRDLYVKAGVHGRVGLVRATLEAAAAHSPAPPPSTALGGETR
jgi:DNA-binding CsgD family transcriptional regulator